jgi:hypothetical protein
MCAGIALAASELPEGLIRTRDLALRLHRREGKEEYRFHARDRQPRIPVWRDGQLELVRWGNLRGESRFLPRTAWTWLASVEEGRWRGTDTLPVDIPVTFALEKGVWYHVTEGIRGVLVRDERENAVCYMLCEPASHYYQVMTRSRRMPVFIDERI